MPDDQRIDELLRDTLGGDVPVLSPNFEARTLRRLRSRGLTTTARVLMCAYVVVATAATTWFMRDLSALPVAQGLALGVSFAAAASVYARRLVSHG